MSDIADVLIDYRLKQNKKLKGNYVYRASDEEVVGVFNYALEICDMYDVNLESLDLTKEIYDTTKDIGVLKRWLNAGVQIFGLTIIPDIPNYNA